MNKVLKRQFFGVAIGELLVLFSCYLIAAVGYHTTLWINSQSWDGGWKLFHFRTFMDTAGLDYLTKLAITLPFWWVMFRLLRNWSLPKRALLHIIGLPLFVVCFRFLYYSLSDLVGYTHLEGYGAVWDIYIPILFYLVQFGIMHAYEYYLDSQRSLKRRAELKEAALKSELAALKAQLNPHFLYNVFNTISASLAPEQERTREMIAKLSDMFRYQLRGSKSEKVPLKEELEFVRTYLELEKARFDTRLTYDLNVEPMAADREIPPMIIQPLVENAVKHGIAPLIDGGKITVDIKAKASHTTFDIRDNGQGLSGTVKGEGVGLQNTRLRLEKMYGEVLQLRNLNGDGVHVHFKIPLA